jgi:chromosomal replication initiator protein
MLDCVTDIPLPGRMLMPADVSAANSAVPQPLPAFVVGPENRLVTSTIESVLHSESTSPTSSAAGNHRLLVLFGPSGVGKSHLAQGLVRHWQSQHGEGSAVYTTAADFRHKLHDAAKRQLERNFREAFRGRQLLVIEDLQYLPSESHTTQELRYTLDDYDERGGIVIVTATTPPSALANLSTDVRSRLAGGLMLQLMPPGEAARARIIRYAATTLGRTLPEATAHRLARSLEGSPNQLFGAVFELCASQANSAVGQNAVEQLIHDRAAQKPTIRDIIAVVARQQNVPQSTLKSDTRRQSTVFARGLVVVLARELAAASYEEIGRALGGRDHTTILHSYRKMMHDSEQDPQLHDTLANLRRILHSR